MGCIFSDGGSWRIWLSPVHFFASPPPQDEQKCVETVELGSYEKCQDLRAVLKRKHRFILLRSPGNKVGAILKAASLWAVCRLPVRWAEAYI